MYRSRYNRFIIPDTKIPCQHIQTMERSNAKLWTIVGEWSLAAPKPCQGKAGEIAKQQIGVYEKGAGWIFWTIKHTQVKINKRGNN